MVDTLLKTCVARMLGGKAYLRGHVHPVLGGGRLLDVVAARLRDLPGEGVVLQAIDGRFNFGFVERKSMVIDGSRDVRGARGLR